MISSDQITIAVTVYNRRQYLKQAIASALNQTVPVKVIVVEDCGPDPTLQDYVRSEFGSSIVYHRNSQRRGLFGNWNACIERCETEWLSILHDDDYLDCRFVEMILELARNAPDRALYFGQTQQVDEAGKPLPGWQIKDFGSQWRNVSIDDALFVTPFPFAGQLFPIRLARAADGFRETSLYCGDWEMWAKLLLLGGGAQVSARVAFNRQHGGFDRGTNRIVRKGLLHPLTLVQHKRVIRLMQKTGRPMGFDRADFLRRFPMSTRYLVANARTMSRMLLRYNVGLLRLSQPPNFRYRVMQWFVMLTDIYGIKLLSRIWRMGGYI